MIDMTCAICAKPFRVKNYRAETARFCSIRCKWSGLAVERSRPLVDRFWEKVDRRAANECWPWTAATTFGGYGVIGEFGKHGRLIRANRLAYILSNGDIGPREVVRHTCDNPNCVNPRHLVAGTKKDNTADMISRGRTNPKRKMTDDQVRTIKSASGTTRAIAAQFGVSCAYVSLVKNGHRR
jgi:hypothetical protein